MDNSKDSAIMTLMQTQAGEELLDKKLERILGFTIMGYDLEGDVCTVHFVDDLKVKIKRNVDCVTVDISDPTYYMDNDTNTTTMSIDRAKFYLQQIAEIIWKDLK